MGPAERRDPSSSASRHREGALSGLLRAPRPGDFFPLAGGGRLEGRGPAPALLPALPLAVASAAAARDVLGKPKPREKMPAILVASKMKSGLPKPVHSAAPILHVPPARTGPQPCYLKLGSKVEVSKITYPSQIPLKSQGLQEPTGEGLPLRKSGSVENGFDTQVRGSVCWALFWEREVNTSMGVRRSGKVGYRRDGEGNLST